MTTDKTRELALEEKELLEFIGNDAEKAFREIERALTTSHGGKPYSETIFPQLGNIVRTALQGSPKIAAASRLRSYRAGDHAVYDGLSGGIQMEDDERAVLDFALQYSAPVEGLAEALNHWNNPPYGISDFSKREFKKIIEAARAYLNLTAKDESNDTE